MFNEFAMQLVIPPPSSLAALKQASDEQRPYMLPRADAALTTASQWLRMMLRPPFTPDRTMPLLPFPMESGRCDVVRASWTAGDLTITTGQTRSMIAIALMDWPWESGESAEVTAGRAAQTIFSAGETRFGFKSSGSNEAGIVGQRDFSAVGYRDERWPNWIDAMWFWSNDTSLGFLTLRLIGGPARAIDASPDEGFNRTWFDPEPLDVAPGA